MSTHGQIFRKFSGGKWVVATFGWIARVPMGWSEMNDFTGANGNYINELLCGANGLCRNMFYNSYYGKLPSSTE